MLFTQVRFFGFLLVVFAVHWALRSARTRKVWLLAASYVFYGCFDWRFLSLLWASTLLDYGFGRAMEGRERPARKPFMIASLVLNLGLLGTFKYFDFFAESAAALLTWIGFQPSAATLSLALPVGISFYTFQTMSYAIDVYRGRIPPERDLLDFALYVGFFPQIAAGPITRAVHIQPQIKAPRDFAQHVNVRAALTLFLLGFIKKACLADGIIAYVDPVFSEPALASQGESWSALLLYHVQIYCDFSGYTDMAIATAWLLGYRLPENFHFPYFARGIGEFWRRWHITLSAWMRDYLYFPLVGKHAGGLRRRASLIVTMGLCGLWHGAGLQFICFGLLHGLYLAVEGLWVSPARLNRSTSRVRSLLSCGVLNFLVILTWPVFRMSTFDDAAALYGNLFSTSAVPGPILSQGTLILVLVCALLHWGAYRFRPVELATRLSTWSFALVYGLAWAFTLPWVAVNLAPFIYFRF